MSTPGSFSYILQGHSGKLKVLDNSTHNELHLTGSPLLQKQFRHIAHQYSNYLALLTVDSLEVSIIGDLFSSQDLYEHEQVLDAEVRPTSAYELKADEDQEYQISKYDDGPDPFSKKQKQVLKMKLRKFDRVKF